MGYKCALHCAVGVFWAKITKNQSAGYQTEPSEYPTKVSEYQTILSTTQTKVSEYRTKLSTDPT